MPVFRFPSSLRSLCVVAGLLLGAGPAFAQPTAVAATAPGLVRPVDALSPAFHKQRRELLRQALPPGAVAVLFAAPVRNRANDVDYIYHQNPDFYYLTGYQEPDAVLVLFKEPQALSGQPGVTEALFVQPRDARREQWTGRRLGTEGAKQQLQLQFAADNAEFAKAGIRWADFSSVLFLDLPADVRDNPSDPADLYDLLATFRRQAAIPANFNPQQAALHRRMQQQGVANAARLRPYLENLSRQTSSVAQDAYVQRYLKATTDAERQQTLAARPRLRFDSGPLDDALNELRAVKTPEEIVLLRRAVRISAVGQQEVMKAAHAGLGERELQGIHEFVYRKYDAEFEGYPSIVGAGANGCILHYETNNKPLVGNDLVLMDCGAEYRGYSADVTRTIPPSGKFSPAQRQIYELVLAAQEAGFAASQPGAAFQAPDQAARKVVTEGLLKLGIIKQPEEARRYFPHGTSHYLGLDVHDRGSYGPLVAGNVITVEPGIYIPAGSPCDQKWWNIGVRIEDDLLITPTGYENLSREAPRTVADIEALMAKPSALDGFKLPQL
ncbi:M24 family metallopeptidase [Hymenobacter lapidiphilus]|uniref:aminopeptidase P N-terminal domain-containing protein n=1 Tax=Hymenobacter sp. CCM 8763 TaxID=2303334 RepID=UPI000E342059|nr:aminopeptidase P N-terminal domain-containing protein [Hymenobacter sp. CCM 8763]RFP66909.1 M24 family metallopeptidase [Hymenobacter sp. CCM 8763]